MKISEVATPNFLLDLDQLEKNICRIYTSDAAAEQHSVDVGGARVIEETLDYISDIDTREIEGEE
ncbi:hypothetical protein [Clostridioides difficile]|uniref:hypothetical protein n=1 Tax=Clostridioides difficile TaxID=1496 RepID=UPI000BB1D18B|nr:hypothetical protein [Clostridioides difficile]PBF34771.1 hypothetical protein BGU49_19795 [Clostridioides difficile]